MASTATPKTVHIIATITLVAAASAIFSAVILSIDGTLLLHHRSLLTGDELSPAQSAEARRFPRAAVVLVASAIAFIIGWSMRGRAGDE